MTPLFGLAAAVAMMLNSFVQSMLGARNPVLAIIGSQARRRAEH